MNEFNSCPATLIGTTVSDGKNFGVVITLTDPNGKKTTIESGFIYKSDMESKTAMEAKVEELIVVFKELGFTAANKMEGMVQ